MTRDENFSLYNNPQRKLGAEEKNKLNDVLTLCKSTPL